MVRGVIMAIHIVSGVGALALGPLALLAARRRARSRTAARDAYFWTMLVVCATAIVLSGLAWTRLWWLVPIAAASYALALVGYLATLRSWPTYFRVHGWGGSYVALVTATLVISLRNASPTAQVLSWALPIAIGVPLIFWAHLGRAHRQPTATPAVPAHRWRPRPG